jgi:predicted MFS family arabinose efflux permease
MLVASAAVLAAASLATAAGGSYAALLWIRFVGGVGATLMLPAILAATADLFSAEARPRAMGVIMACSGGSMVVGWPAAAVVSVRWGWRAVFVMLGVAFIAEVALVMGILPGSRPGAGLAATLRQSYGRVLRDRRVVSVALAGCLSAASWFGFMTYLGWYLATQCGLATGHQAPVLSAMGVGYSVASLAAGGGIRRVGAARVAIGASASAAACALAMTARSGLWTAVAGAVVIATLRGAGVTAISDLLIGLRPEDRGTVAGLNALGFSVGVLMGAGLGGLALANGGYRLLFFTLSALAAGASVLLARRGRSAEAHRFAPAEP